MKKPVSIAISSWFIIFSIILLILPEMSPAVSLSFPNGCTYVVNPGGPLREDCSVPGLSASGNSLGVSGVTNSGSQTNAGSSATNPCDGTRLPGTTALDLTCGQSSPGVAQVGSSSPAVNFSPGSNESTDLCFTTGECP